MQFAQAAREVGVDLIVNMSQISARREAKSDAALQHWLSERVFDRSGVPVTHLRPTYFAEWLLYMRAMIREDRISVPFGPAGRHAPIAAEDQAAVIAAVLAAPDERIVGDRVNGVVATRGEEPIDRDVDRAAGRDAPVKSVQKMVRSARGTACVPVTSGLEVSMPPALACPFAGRATTIPKPLPRATNGMPPAS